MKPNKGEGQLGAKMKQKKTERLLKCVPLQNIPIKIDQSKWSEFKVETLKNCQLDCDIEIFYLAIQ